MTEPAPITEYKTVLDEELLSELCRIHRDGKDFRNVTAIRCHVHPMRLKTWLWWGEKSGQDERVTLYTRLYLEFARIEAELRAANIAEVLNTIISTEDVTFEGGVPVSKTVVKRSTNGVQWYMERRWRQYRADWEPNDLDRETVLMAGLQTAGALTTDAAEAICSQLAEAMPPRLLEIFTARGWTPPKLEAATRGKE